MFYIVILMVQTKLFSDLYIAKFLDTLAKSFFRAILYYRLFIRFFGKL